MWSDRRHQVIRVVQRCPECGEATVACGAPACGACSPPRPSCTEEVARRAAAIGASGLVAAASALAALLGRG